MRKLITYGWGVIFGLVLLTGCSSHYYLEGKALENQGEFTAAAQQYERAAKGNKKLEAHEKLAEIYTRLNAHEKAIASMDTLEANGGLPGDMPFEKAETLLALGRYDEAKEMYLWMSEKGGRDATVSESRLTMLSSLDSRQADSINFRLRSVEIISIDEGGAQLVSAAAPFRSGDKLFFTVEKPREYRLRRGVEMQLDNYTGNRLTDLWEAEIVDTTGLQGTIYLLAKPMTSLNTELHDGFVAHQEGDSVGVISMSYVQGKLPLKEMLSKEPGETILKPIQLFNAALKEDSTGLKTWQAGDRMSFCDKRYMFAHPAISPNGNSIYFTSNKPGGYGGMDIWRVDKKGNGWGRPVNCGDVVNSSGNEAFPTMRNADTLYFSSDGHLSMGGLDVVYATKSVSSGGWTELYDRLPHPINSSRDDFGLQLDPVGYGGFFTSDRTGIDALYHFHGFETEVILNIKVVHDKDGSPWPGLGAVLAQNAHGLGKLAMDDMSFVSDNAGKWSVLVDRGANYQVNCLNAFGYIPEPFTAPLDQTINEFTIIVRIPLIIEVGCKDPVACNYEPKALVADDSCTYPGVKFDCDGNCINDKDEDGVCDSDEIPGCTSRHACNYDPNATDDDNSCEYMTCVEVTIGEAADGGPGETVDLNIHWDYNRSFLRAEDRPGVASFAAYLLANPEYHVLLTSHCDLRATESFNDELSQRRASTILKSLVSQGVSESRLTSFGASEQFPINDCRSEDCTDEEHQVNRRTTAKILFSDQIIVIHKVANGETLGAIAEKHEVRVWDIKAWNRVNSKKLRIGQELLIYKVEAD